MTRIRQLNQPFVLTVFLLFPLHAGHADDQGKIDQLITVIERLCLSGAQYQLTADANGNINLQNLTPGAQGAINVNIRQQMEGSDICERR